MNIYEFTVKTIEGESISLDRYRGKVLLIVNVASQCSFTRQYRGLESLYRKYHDRGFEILGFPCNQFFHQEPGDEATIRKFCSTKYDVSFPMFAKIEVNGPNTHPLYQFLKKEQPGWFGVTRIGWNFVKFLVNRQGDVMRRYSTMSTPAGLEKDIEALL